MGDLLGSPRVAPPFCFPRQFGHADDSFAFAFFFFFFALGPSASRTRSWSSGGRPPGFGAMCVGRPGQKTEGNRQQTEGTVSRMVESDPAGGAERACPFTPTICSSRAFRRYIIIANRAGGSKVTAPTTPDGPRGVPIRMAQVVSFANIPRVRSYQR